jgi:hypothetical protein
MKNVLQPFVQVGPSHLLLIDSEGRRLVLRATGHLNDNRPLRRRSLICRRLGNLCLFAGGLFLRHDDHEDNDQHQQHINQGVTLICGLDGPLPAVENAT